MKALVDVHRLDKLEEIASNVFAMSCSVETTQALRNLERAATLAVTIYDREKDNDRLQGA